MIDNLLAEVRRAADEAGVTLHVAHPMTSSCSRRTNAQVGALRRRLRDAGVQRVGTVDKFQGQEAAVVVYSCTSSSPEDAPRGLEFLYDPHRFNVATSRARGVVIVVANPRLFEAECRMPAQMRMVNGLCRYRELARVVEWDPP